MRKGLGSKVAQFVSDLIVTSDEAGETLSKFLFPHHVTTERSLCTTETTFVREQNEKLKKYRLQSREEYSILLAVGYFLFYSVA
jgi:hypothetical protein